jgi:signal transduction histidine kinase
VLLDNAVKFAPSGGKVNLIAERNGTSAILRVRDDGPGFSRAGLERATARFWREDSARGRSGSGLGLAIARAIIEQAGGTINLANAPTGGADVTVHIPLTKP